MSLNELFEKSIQREVNGKSFSEKDKHLLLYGAGNLGRKLCRCLQNNKIYPKAFIDEKGVAINNTSIPIYQLADKVLDEFIDDKTEIILSGLFGLEDDKKIRGALRNKGFYNVHGLYEINWNSLVCKDFLNNVFIGEYNLANNLEHDKLKIWKAYNLFETDDEKEFYESYIKGYLYRDVTIFPKPLPLDLQYVGHDIPIPINYECFIDCGAFNGDTLRNFIEKNICVRHYIAFEPQMSLFSAINEILQQSDVQVATLYPCGVSDCFEHLSFSTLNEYGQSASKVSLEGSEVIQCVPIDEVLYGVAPTCIKMDIEGMELKALKGAKKTIQKYLPQLAICVYHDINHIWEIPLLIKSFYAGYRFYIRNYQFMGLETVVYAIPDKE